MFYQKTRNLEIWVDEIWKNGKLHIGYSFTPNNHYRKKISKGSLD